MFIQFLKVPETCVITIRKVALLENVKHALTDRCTYEQRYFKKTNGSI